MTWTESLWLTIGIVILIIIFLVILYYAVYYPTTDINSPYYEGNRNAFSTN